MSYENSVKADHEVELLVAGVDPARFHINSCDRLLDYHARHVARTAVDPSYPPVGPFLLRRIADARPLMAAAMKLRANGRKSPGLSDIQLHDLDRGEMWLLCRTLGKSIRTGIYRPGPEKKVRIRKEGKPGKFRQLTIQSTEDRIVGKGALLILQLVVDRVFSPFSFGFRPQSGTWSALATAMALMHRDGRAVWVSADVEKAFDRVPFAPFLTACNKHFPGDVVDFIALIAHTGKKRGVRQGSPFSPFAFNLFADHFLDRPWHDRHPGIPLLRYADDLAVICRSVDEATNFYADLARLARSAGVPLKGTVGESVFDLRLGQSVDWLGYRLQIANGRVTIRIADRAWDRLDHRLAKAHLLPGSPLRAVQIAHGWLNYLGPTFDCEDVRAVAGRVRQIGAAHAFAELPAAEDLIRIAKAARRRWNRLYQRESALLPDRLFRIGHDDPFNATSNFRKSETTAVPTDECPNCGSARRAQEDHLEWVDVGRCPTCGDALPGDGATCSLCGTLIECPSCGRDLRPVGSGRRSG